MAGIPKLKASEIFNKLSHVQLEDVDLARGFAQELAALNKVHPGDFVTKVSFAEALLLSGNREFAIDQMQGAFSVRDRDQYAVMDRLAVLFMFVADRVKALQLVEEIAFNENSSDGEFKYDNQAIIAGWAVDIDLLQRLVNRDAVAEPHCAAKIMLDALIEIGSIESLRSHQHALIDAVKDLQVSICFLSADEGTGRLIAVNNVFFDGTKIGRRELEERVRAQIDGLLPPELDGAVRNIFTAAPHPEVTGLRVIDGGLHP